MQDKPTVKPDWLSWTVYPVAPDTYQINDLWRSKWFNDVYAKYGLAIETKSTSAGRKPYSRKHEMLHGMGKLFYGPKLDYATVELTGKGCTMIMQNDGFEMVAEMALETCTRFDVAVDYRTEVTPLEFYEAGVSSRIKAWSIVESGDGQTVYIGSPKSDLYCRVYKYNPPHERAGLLRIEFVARRKKAKRALKAWLEDGPIFCVGSLARSFDFKHTIWTSGSWHGCILDARTESTRDVHKTRKWLLTQVKPAMLRLAATDDLPPEFLTSLFEGIPFVSVTYDWQGMTTTDVLHNPDREGQEPPPWSSVF